MPSTISNWVVFKYNTLNCQRNRSKLQHRKGEVFAFPTKWKTTIIRLSCKPPIVKLNVIESLGGDKRVSPERLTTKWEGEERRSDFLDGGGDVVKFLIGHGKEGR